MGVTLGVIGPVLGILGYYFIKFYPTFSLAEYFYFFKAHKSSLTAISSLSLIVNIVFFTYYTNTNRDQTAKGIFVITLIYAVIVLLFKLIA